ncbi:MAG: phage tail sheath family protein, partial [Sphingobacteriales bacterium]
FVIIDIVQNDNDPGAAIETFDSNLQALTQPGVARYGAAYFPMLVTTIPYHYTDSTVRIAHHVTRREAGKEDQLIRGNFDKLKLPNVQVQDAGLYTAIKDNLQQQTYKLPPSAAVAGIYVQVDRARGVWKAPANISLAMVKSPALLLTNHVQSSLQNGEISGRSINAIRQFTGKGTVVWGGRTLAGSDNEWRYISVRRFFNMVETSVQRSTEQFVFEPNEMSTWSKVKQMVENFLLLQWRAGALQGIKPEQAYFVHIGLGSSMTQQDVIDGRMIIEIGMAIVRPAEFILTRIVLRMQSA